MSKAYKAMASARTVVKTGRRGEFAASGKSGFDLAALASLIGDGSAASKEGPQLVLEGTRRRPRYFDGRFLTGQDLARDQEYIRRRQSDVARAVGFGVIEGLGVSEPADSDGTEIVIGAGQGVTPAGAIVAIDRDLPVRLADLPAIRELDSRFGVALQASQPLDKRRGLFILALRPVEYQANPISSYPTSITGERRMTMGDIVEATAVTLAPVDTQLSSVDLDRQRGDLARQIFCGKEAAGELQDALPLAMLALDNGSIRWLDVSMVRREVGGDTPLQTVLSGRRRALAEAHLLQYDRHLSDLLDRFGAEGLTAARHFPALPPVGRMPLAAVKPDAFGFLQSFFPPEVKVEVGFAAADELAVLVEESLNLPPIDLAGDPSALAATRVVMLMPVERAMLPGLLAGLPSSLAPAAAQGPGGPAKAPSALLTDLLIRPQQPPAASQTGDPMAPWRAAWGMAASNLAARRDDRSNLIWFMRRRAVPAYPLATTRTSAPPPPPEPPPVVPPPTPTPAPEPLADSGALRRAWRDLHISELRLKGKYQTLQSTAAAGRTAIDQYFASPQYLVARPVFCHELARLVQTDPGTITEPFLRKRLAEAQSRNMGLGFQALQAASKDEELNRKICLSLAELPDSVSTPSIDRWLQLLGDITPEQARRITEVLETGDPDRIRSMLSGEI